jgi:hypothetical protein
MFSWLKRPKKQALVVASQALILKKIAESLPLDLLSQGLKPQYAHFIVRTRYATLVLLIQRLTYTLEILASEQPPLRGGKLLEEEEVFLFDFFSESTHNKYQLTQHLEKFQTLSIDFLMQYFALENKPTHDFSDTQKLKIAMTTFAALRTVLQSFSSFQLD